MSVGADVLAHLVARVASAPARLGSRRPTPGPRMRLVCIDGPAGSGKTTLAAQLAAALPAGAPPAGALPAGALPASALPLGARDAAAPSTTTAHPSSTTAPDPDPSSTTSPDLPSATRAPVAPVQVVHMDDLYEGWDGGPGAAAGRLHAWVLDPLDRGEPGRYRRYDWTAGAFAEWHDVPLAAVLIVEGCGSAPRSVAPLAALTIWVEAPDDVRLARGLARDGAGERDHWLRWMVDEAASYAREGTRERADVRIDGFGALAGDRSLRSSHGGGVGPAGSSAAVLGERGGS